jgi:hypothetical protein
MLFRAAWPLALEHADIRQRCAALGSLLEVDARRPGIMVRLCTEPAHALEIASAHILISSCGFHHAGMDRMLDTIAAQALMGPERLPNHTLEYVWLAGIRNRALPDRMDSLLAMTGLGSPLDVLACSITDLYNLTHAVLYATDMGMQLSQLPRPLVELEQDFSAALAIAAQAGNFDLIAELLWFWPMARLPFNAEAAFAFLWLLERQDECGFVPGPTFEPANRSESLEPISDRHVLETSYHASIGTGILLAALLNANTNTEPCFNERASAHDLPEMIVGSEDRWYHPYMKQSKGFQALLSGFVLTAKLRKAYAERDAACLHDVLTFATEVRATTLPAVQQAHGFLRRLLVLQGLGQANSG